MVGIFFLISKWKQRAFWSLMLAVPGFLCRQRIVAAWKNVSVTRFSRTIQRKTDPLLWVGSCWRYLSSRAVTRKVLSAKVCLTSVFGMGTGGPTPQSTPTFWALRYTLKTEHDHAFCNHEGRSLSLLASNCRSSPRLISTSQLHTLLCFHLWPINDIVYVEPYSISGWEILS